MSNIAIYGAGGFGREVACLINSINEKKKKWNIIGFFDDTKSTDETVSSLPILGGLNELNGWKEPISLVIAIASPAALKKISGSIFNNNITFPNLIAPDVNLLDSENLKIGKGNIICSGGFISCDIRIGNFNIMNCHISLGHDVIIGSYNCLMPAVRISGNVTAQDGNFFGVSSVVLQRLKIGNSVTLGAGSVLIRNPKSDSTYVGNPALIIKF